MICTSINTIAYKECIELIPSLEMAEIRLDCNNFSMKELENIFSLSTPLIATFRPNKLGKEERKKALIKAIHSGASYVDIEYEEKEKYKQDIISIALHKNCKVIISYHNFEITPKKEILKEIVKDCFNMGAHVAKIACMVHNYENIIDLLSLYKAQGKMISIGMGDIGKITRIAAPLLGAPFTYASLSKIYKTAPGQIDTNTMKTIFDVLSSKEQDDTHINTM